MHEKASPKGQWEWEKVFRCSCREKVFGVTFSFWGVRGGCLDDAILRVITSHPQRQSSRYYST